MALDFVYNLFNAEYVCFTLIADNLHCGFYDGIIQIRPRNIKTSTEGYFKDSYVFTGKVIASVIVRNKYLLLEYKSHLARLS